jgi:hypothetical protein
VSAFVLFLTLEGRARVGVMGFGVTAPEGGGGVGGVYMVVGVFSRASKILFGNMVCSPFKWLLFTYSA